VEDLTTIDRPDVKTSFRNSTHSGDDMDITVLRVTAASSSSPSTPISQQHHNIQQQQQQLQELSLVLVPSSSTWIARTFKWISETSNTHHQYNKFKYMVHRYGMMMVKCFRRSLLCYYGIVIILISVLCGQGYCKPASVLYYDYWYVNQYFRINNAW
jgi:hypothetical protein